MRRMEAQANPVLVELTRGETVESVHRGAVAICDARGDLKLALGDLDRPVFARSAYKMIQALPLVETGAADRFRLTERELALACASHSGERVHVETVRAWLADAGCGADDLACGAHAPSDEAAAAHLIRTGEAPTRLHNNCSGKHAGFLCVCRHLGEPTAGYERIDHPLQRRVRQTLGEMCDADPEAMPWGVDGCSAPNFALPLRKLARGFARLADPAGLGPARADAARRLTAASKAWPLLGSGSGRGDEAFIRLSGGGTVTKIGAEGVYAAILPRAGLGVALKIDDGAPRAAETAMAALLVSLGALGREEAAPWLAPPIVNWRGEICGVRRPAATLQAALGA